MVTTEYELHKLQCLANIWLDSGCLNAKLNTNVQLRLLQLLKNTKCRKSYQQVKALTQLTLVRLPQVSGMLPSNPLLLKFSLCNCTINQLSELVKSQLQW